jgi:hypothetical protein
MSKYCLLLMLGSLGIEESLIPKILTSYKMPRHFSEFDRRAYRHNQLDVCNILLLPRYKDILLWNPTGTWKDSNQEGTLMWRNDTAMWKLHLEMSVPSVACNNNLCGPLGIHGIIALPHSSNRHPLPAKLIIPSTLSRRSSSKLYLRIQSVPQREHNI